MLADFLDDLLLRFRVFHLGITVRPVATRMKRVSGRAHVGPRSRIVAVFVKAVTDADFGVGDRGLA